MIKLKWKQCHIKIDVFALNLSQFNVGEKFILLECFSPYTKTKMAREFLYC